MTKRGYKSPPVEHQFKKGKSGNPKGRPKKKTKQHSDLGLDLIASLYRELRKSVFVQENGKHREITKLDAFSAQLVAQSVNGKPSQQKMLLGLLTLDRHEVDVSRFSAAPSSHLSGYPFESQGAFPA